MQTAEHVVTEDLDQICRSLEVELQQLAGKQLLLTGGAGFLGHYLIQAILHWNAKNCSAPVRLTVYDSYERGVPDWLKRLESNPQLKLVKHDVTQPLPQGIEDFSYIIHAASIASPIYYRQHPIETMDANVNGLRALLEYCRNQKAKGKPVEGFLFFSTSEIYGDPTPENIPTPETYRGNVSCTGPRACYDEAKRFGETLCVTFAQHLGLPVKMARPFNNYGPGLKITDGRVIPDFARDILAGRDIVLLSDGAPTRTFCYVADAVVGYYKILTRGRGGEPYNIGVETPEISVTELADRIVRIARELFGYNGRVVRGRSADREYLTDNPTRRCPVIQKARTELGYNPSVGLDEGLRRSLIWYRENGKAADA